MSNNNNNNNHKTVESPWTKRKYVIRELDPAILAICSKPETPEIKNLRKKIQDKLDDINREENREKQSGQKDESLLDAMKKELEMLYTEMQKLNPLDEKELENRRKIVQYGLVTPKIKTDDDYLDLGKDASFLWGSIIGISDVPKDYAEVMQSLFRQQQSDNIQGGSSG